MKTRKLGSSGIEVSVVGLGCNNFGVLDVESSRKVVGRALDLGVTLLDTADIYGNRGGSETQLGEILGPRRKDIVLATKFGMAMDDDASKARASRGYIMDAVEASLKRLKTDWIDLYQLHTPDPKTPMEETLRALDDLVKAGKARAVGCSNLAPQGVRDAAVLARAKGLSPFVTAQDEYSLVVRGAEKALMPALEESAMSLLPYFPLASGLLTGKYARGSEIPANTRFGRMQRFSDRYMNEENWAIVERLSAFCEARDKSLLDLAFAWLLAHPVLASVIAGATRPEQIEANVKAAQWELSADELAEVNRLSAKT
ncbi:MAG TPA: aldo/keto reductase [Rhizomicrobium sp.]|nr:aldo/keto reductase [Rhizomicrobium sp.]